MRRYVYAGLFVAVFAPVGGLIFYRTTPVTSPSFVETPAQVAVATDTPTFGGVSLSLEYATTTASRELGLGGREFLEPDQDMLFVFKKADRYGFWMKDTLIPLDMFWLDNKGQVVSIAQDVATSSYPSVFYPSAPALYVLETVAGFAREHSIATGTPLQLKSFPTVTE